MYCHRPVLTSISRMLPVVLEQKNGDKLNININVWEKSSTESQSDSPVVMAIHGVPGSAEDFTEIAENLAQKDFRFIVPEFPGFGQSKLEKQDIYKLEHTTEGKYKMLKSIVSALELDRIDVLIGHSAGTWLAYKACADMDIVKSGVFLNPLGARPHRAASPYAGVRAFAWGLRSPLFHPLCFKLLPTIYKIVGFTVTDPYPLQVAVETVGTCGFENMARYANTIKEKKLPVLFAWTVNDKIVEGSVSTEMAHMMGVMDGEIINIDKENRKTFSSNLDKDNLFRRAIMFERGGHVIQKAHQDEITDHIHQILYYLDRSRWR